MRLQRIKYLFLNLFQLVLHHYHNVLHLSLVRLRAGSINFAPHFMCYEAQLLTYMRLTNKHLGLLINFNVPLLKDGIIRRII